MVGNKYERKIGYQLPFNWLYIGPLEGSVSLLLSFVQNSQNKKRKYFSPLDGVDESMTFFVNDPNKSQGTPRRRFPISPSLDSQLRNLVNGVRNQRHLHITALLLMYSSNTTALNRKITLLLKPKVQNKNIRLHYALNLNKALPNLHCFKFFCVRHHFCSR